MNKVFLLCLLAGLSWSVAAQSAWRGQAGVITDGSLPDTGYLAASNEFPRNTIVTVENLKTHQSLKVRILKRSPAVLDANFIFLNTKAAQDLTIKAGDSTLVSVQIDTGLEGIRSSLMEDSPTNPDPEMQATTFTGKGVVEPTPTTTEPTVAIKPVDTPTDLKPVAPEKPTPAPEFTLAPADYNPALGADLLAARTPEKQVFLPPRDTTMLAAKAPELSTELLPATTDGTGSKPAQPLATEPGPAVAVVAADSQVPAGEIVSPPTLVEAPLSGTPADTAPPAVEAPDVEAITAADSQVPAGEPSQPSLVETPLTGQPAATAPTTPDAAPLAVVAADVPVQAGTLPPATDKIQTTQPADTPKPQTDKVVSTEPIKPAPIKPVEPVKPVTPQKPVVTPPVTLKPATTKARREVPLISDFKAGADYVQIASFKDEASLFQALDRVHSPVQLSLLMTDNAKAPFRLVAGPLPRDQLGILVMDYRSQGYRSAEVVQGR